MEALGSLSEAGEAVAEVGEEDQEVSTAQDGQQQGKQVPHAPTVQTIVSRSSLLLSLYIIGIDFLKLDLKKNIKPRVLQ